MLNSHMPRELAWQGLLDELGLIETSLVSTPYIGYCLTMLYSIICAVIEAQELSLHPLLGLDCT